MLDRPLSGRVAGTLSVAFLLAALSPGAMALQTSEVPFDPYAYEHDTGPLSNPSGDWRVLASFEVRIPGASWLQLHFEETELGGDRFEEGASFLRVTSHEDAAFQELDAHQARRWRQRTAYFNGEAVQVELVAAPHTGANRLVLSEVRAGKVPVPQESQCGPSDDRQPSSDPRSARIVPVGCTGWLIDDCAHCFLTAGHCVGSSLQTVQFNVPLSDSDGSINHPPPQDQYPIDASSIQSVNGGAGNDWGYFGAFPNAGTDLTAFEAQGAAFTLEPPPPYDSSDDIRITGYGVDSSPQTYNQIQQTHVGPWLGLFGTRLEYQTDTQGGNSGSPVIHEQSGAAIGIHTHGGCSASSGNSGTSAGISGLQNALADPRGVCEGGIRLAGGVPDIIEPGVETDVDVEIIGGAAPGSALLFYRYDGGAFLSVPLVSGGGDLYRGTLPPADCDSVPEYYFSADTGSCGLITLPADGPLEPFTAEVGFEDVAFEDDMEGDLGWQVGAPTDDATTGVWVRVNPIGTEAQPEDDHTPSPGTICWVTGQGSVGGSLGEDDVDNGSTTLTTPVLDAGGLGEARISYWRWYSNHAGSSPHADVFQVDISDDGGASWTPVETVGPSGPETEGGWTFHSLRVADYVNPTNQVRVRFVASDLGSGSIVEAAVDDFKLSLVTCDDLVGEPYCFCDSGSPCLNPDRDGGCFNSTGQGALLYGTGSASVGADDLVLTVEHVPAGQSGVVFMGGAQVETPFGDGLLCVGAGGTGLFRFPVQAATPEGILTEGPGIVAFSQGAFSPPGQIAAGQTWQFQGWFRDPAGICGSSFNLSNGVEVVFTP